MIRDARNRFRRLDYRQEKIGLVIGFSVLHNRCHPLQSHAGIDILARKLPVFGTVLAGFGVILTENDVPNLDETVGVDIAADRLDAESFRIKFGAAIVEDFRTGTARAFADLPEIRFQRDNMVAGNAETDPFLDRLDVRGVDGKIQAINIETEPAGRGQKLNRPG